MAPSSSDPTYFDPITVRDVHIMGKDMMNRGKNRLGKFKKGGTEDRRFRDFFGTFAGCVLDAWSRILRFDLLPKGGRFYHLLWALMFMKIYGKEADLCAHAGGTGGAVDPKTFRKWTWPFVEALAEMEYHVVLMSNRYINSNGNDALLSLDCADFRVPDWGKNFFTHKFKACGLRYEIALCIATGWICWTYGPKATGINNDLMVFRQGLMNELDENEKVIADGIYRGESPHTTKMPHTVHSYHNEEQETLVRARHEHINKRYKMWGCLGQKWRHVHKSHQTIFHAVTCMEQLRIENGEPLGHVDYYDGPPAE